MRSTQRLVAATCAVLATWTLTACQTKPATAPAPTASKPTTAATATGTVAARPAASAARPARPAAPTAAERAAAAKLAREHADSLDRIRLAAKRADSIADAAVAAKNVAAIQASLKNTLAIAVLFDPDTAKIRLDARDQLDKKVPILLANPALTVRITGHAYERHSDADNTQLGLSRAEAAKHYMVIQGVADKQVETVGHADKPTATDDATLAQLRRDDFDVTASPPVLKNP